MRQERKGIGLRRRGGGKDLRGEDRRGNYNRNICMKKPTFN